MRPDAMQDRRVIAVKGPAYLGKAPAPGSPTFMHRVLPGGRDPHRLVSPDHVLVVEPILISHALNDVVHGLAWKEANPCKRRRPQAVVLKVQKRRHGAVPVPS